MGVRPLRRIGDAMSHAVHFRSADGSTTFEPVASLDAALARVEQLRNEQGVSEVRVYREVPVTFRTYYKATVAEEPAAAAPTPAPTGADETAPPAPPAAPPGAMPLSPPATAATADDGDETADEPSGGRGSLFSRG